VWKKEVARDGFWWVEDPHASVAASLASASASNDDNVAA